MKQEEAVFAQAGLSCSMKQCHTEEELIRDCAGYAVALNQYAPFTERVIRELSPDLRLVVRYGVGVNNIDLEAATAHGVRVCNVPDYGMNEVADHAMALSLALWRKIPLLSDNTKHGEWDYTKAIPIGRLSECTVGIVGLGRIGLTYAKRMRAFGARLIGSDPFRETGSEVEGVKVCTFDEVVTEADIISVHAMLNDATRNMFCAEVFRKMKQNAVLINVSRGGIINEADLFAALREGEIAGAGLDVLEEEPVASDHPLLSVKNCILTPHVAWYSEEASAELKRKVAEEAVRFVRGEALLYPVNKPVA